MNASYYPSLDAESLRFLRHHTAHQRLLMRRILLVNDLFLCCGIDGFVDRRENLLGILKLPFFHEIAERAHDRLHVRLERKSACFTLDGLAGTLGGGLDNRHSARSLGERMEQCKGKVQTFGGFCDRR